MKIAAIATLALLAASSAHAAAPQAVISFAAPTKYTDGTDIAAGTAITYFVYQGLSGANKAKVATITGLSTTITTGLAAGSNYCFSVTAVISGQESAQSNEQCKAFAFPTPGAVVITVQ